MCLCTLCTCRLNFVKTYGKLVNSSGCVRSEQSADGPPSRAWTNFHRELKRISHCMSNATRAGSALGRQPVSQCQRARDLDRLGAVACGPRLDTRVSLKDARTLLVHVLFGSWCLMEVLRSSY